MQQNSSDERGRNVKSARSALWIMLIVGALFCAVIIKFIVSANNSNDSAGLPTQEEAYTVAQHFIKSDSRSGDVTFSNDDYQIAKQSDSVYAIKTEVEAHNNEENIKQHFTVKMRYNGGPGENENSWSLLDIHQN